MVPVREFWQFLSVLGAWGQISWWAVVASGTLLAVLLPLALVMKARSARRDREWAGFLAGHPEIKPVTVPEEHR